MLHLLALLAIPLLGASRLLGDLDFQTSLLLFVLSLAAVAAELLQLRGRRHISLVRLLLVCILLYVAQLSIILYPRFARAHAVETVHHAMRANPLSRAVELKKQLHEVVTQRKREAMPQATPKAMPTGAQAPSFQVVAATLGANAVAAVAPEGNFGGLELKRKDFKTISLVFPCADERENALMTVDRFCKRTPADQLAEIIVVDDGSTPPMRELFAKDERRLDLDKRCKLKIVRHESTIGLMAAKLTGGKAATGDVVAFFDCHCSPKKGWHKEIIQQIQQNPRRMVVPAITDLDMDTFDEKANSAVNAKCYLTFDCDFKWFDDESDFIPTISGGLVAMSQEWFNLTGGFDEEMHGWGGENLDQSLRAWLCGGEITRSKSSRIAHMWRTGDRRTGSHYHIRAKPTNNRGRVASAWFDDFLPVYRGSKVSSNEVRNFDSVKKRLGCRPFVYFLYRFRKIYIESGVIAKTVFNLREKASGLCLGRGGAGVRGASCAQTDRNQRLQLGNVNRETGKCCSGIRHYGGNDCIDQFQESNGLHWYSCDVSGQNGNQQYHLRDDGRLEKMEPGTTRSAGCIYIDAKKKKVAKRPCDELDNGVGIFEKAWEEEPQEFKIYKAELKRHRIEEEFPHLPDN